MVLKSLEGIVTIEAAAASDNKHDHSQNRLLNLLRRNIGVHAGDFEFTIRAVPRSIQSWDEFKKEFDEWKDWYDGEDSAMGDDKQSEISEVENYIDEDTKDHNLLLGLTPADVLWTVTNYGDFRWGWGIREYVDPDDRPDDISEMRSRVIRNLDDVPARVRYLNYHKVGIKKADFKKRVLQDVDMLMLIVREYGTFGDAMVPDALSPITLAHIHYDDGNVKHACFASDKYNYSIVFHTS